MFVVGTEGFRYHVRARGCNQIPTLRLSSGSAPRTTNREPDSLYGCANRTCGRWQRCGSGVSCSTARFACRGDWVFVLVVIGVLAAIALIPLFFAAWLLSRFRLF